MNHSHTRVMRHLKIGGREKPATTPPPAGRLQGRSSRRGGIARLPGWLKLVLMTAGVALFEVVYLFTSQNISPFALLEWLRSLVDRLLG